MSDTFSKAELILIRAYGDEDEVERLDAELLSPQDGQRVVREVVFGPIYDWPSAAAGLKPAAVVHLQNLRYPAHKLPLNARVEFSTGPSSSLGREEFMRFKALNQAFGDARDVAPLTVTAKVGKLTHRRHKARVVVALGPAADAKCISRDVWLDVEDGEYAVGYPEPWRDLLRE